MSGEYLWFEGIPFPNYQYDLETLKSVGKDFVVTDEDVLTVTYPRSGTNWLLEIICLICSKGDPKWVQSVPIWECSPWIETPNGCKLAKDTEGPRLLTSHLPIHLFPKSFFGTKAKVIYLIRDPRDILVSGYFLWKSLKMAKEAESLEQYLEWFIQGNVVYGSWFDHIRGWLSMREKENFLMLTYEELKQDPRGSAKKICQFLGKKLEPGELESVLKYSSFEVMKENKMCNYTILENHILDHTRGSFIRKGISGDWKNHFTVAQAEAFDKIYQEKTAGLPRELFPWE